MADEVPVAGLHLVEQDIAQDTGIVDDDIDLAEGVDGILDDALRAVPFRNGPEARDRDTARGHDLVGDAAGRTGIAAVAAKRNAEIIDDNTGTPACRQLGDTFANTATGTGDDDDLAVKQCCR